MIQEKIYNYCTEHSNEESAELQELRRQTYLRTIRPHMLSGPLQGQMLLQLVRLFKVKRALEIGTFTGYATLCIAEGLLPGGKVHTIELEEELKWFHGQFFNNSVFGNRIKCHYGDANDIIPKLESGFDFVFMDAGKKDYQNQLEMVIEKMEKGGVILADNVLWKGKVTEPTEEHEKMTAQIHAFNTFVKNDARVSNVILPIRDGLNMITIL